jgi:hypothetical protein
MSAEETLEIVGTNAVSWFVVLATFNINSVIPPPDRLIEWCLGLMVAVSVVAFNSIRAYHYWKQSRKP